MQYRLRNFSIHHSWHEYANHDNAQNAHAICVGEYENQHLRTSGAGAGGGVWKSKWVVPSWAQVGGPKLGPSGWAQAGPKRVGPELGPRGWAQAGPKWVGPSRAQVGGPRIHRFGPLGIEVEKQGFRTAWLITGQKFP